jgi:uncharacterized membrane protein SpoIIM required for sporulation
VNRAALGIIGRAYAGLWCAAAVGAVATLVVPGARAAARAAFGLHPGAHAHPTVATAAALCVHNAVVALWPAALGACGVGRVPVARRAFDICVATSLAANGALVGTALAAYGPRLVPDLVQLPAEWLALAVGAGAWWSERRRPEGLGKARLALFAAALVMIAAALEVYATPS